MRKPIRVGLAAAVALSIALLSACGGNSGGGGGGGGKKNSSGDVTLTWTMWTGGTADRDAWEAAAAAVHKANPKITVKLQTAAFNDYFAKIGTQIASGTAPCIISAQSLRLGALKAGMVPLDSMMKSANFDSSDIVPNALKGLQADGHQYGLPYDNGPILMLYNKNLFTKAGIPLPKNGWTVADFMNTAKKLSGNGNYAEDVFPGDLQMFSQVLAASGVQPVSTDGKLQLTDPALVKGVTDYASLVHQYKYAPKLAGADSTVPFNTFLNGHTAMVADGPWDFLSLKGQVKFPMGAVTLPAGPAGAKTLSAGSGFGISKTCPYKAEAFKALETLTGQGVLTALASAGRAFPARISAEQGWYGQAFAGAKEALDAASASAEPFRTTDNWSQLATDLTQFGPPVFNGDGSMSSVMSQLQKKYGK